MRILLISTTLPWPLEQFGGAQRSGLLLKALRNWGDVDVLVASEKEHFEWPGVFEKMDDSSGYGIRKLELDFTREAGPWRQLAPLARGKLKSLLHELARCKADFTPERTAVESMRQVVRDGGYDIVVVRHLRSATKTGSAFLLRTKVLLDYDDIDWQVHRTREEVSDRPIIKRFRDDCTSKYLEGIARRSLPNFAHIWAASEEDQTEIALQHCSVLPNVPILPPAGMRDSRKDGPRDDTILFVATLGYSPNTQGLDRFLSRVWPAVHQAHPGVHLKVVGKPPEDSQQVEAWKQAPNVDFLGFVENLDDSYARALFTIAPIYWGGGTKIKVLESLGRGRTCVATPHALFGVGQHIRHDDSVWCADMDEDFVQGCITLLETPDLRKRMEVKGAAVVQEHYSIETFNQAVDKVMCQFQESAATGKT